jgi:anti-sigma factor RsiW
MCCRPISLEFDAYLCRELSPARAKRVRAHVRRCPACRQQLAEFKLLHQFLAQHRPQPPAPRLPVGQRLLQLSNCYRLLPNPPAAALPQKKAVASYRVKHCFARRFKL